jgi:hypothetical protein
MGRYVGTGRFCLQCAVYSDLYQATTKTRITLSCLSICSVATYTILIAAGRNEIVS